MAIGMDIRAGTTLAVEIGHLGQDSSDKTAGTGQLGQDSRGRTDDTGSQDRIVGTGKSGQAGLASQPGHISMKRTERTGMP
jgi:hypothetical protein